MSDRKCKQIAALIRLREHRERTARLSLQSEIQDLKKLHIEAEEKDNLIEDLTVDLYTGLEDRLLNDHTVMDPGARFTTFAMSVNAARENLILEEALAASLKVDLKSMRGSVVVAREHLKIAYQKLEKAQHIARDLEKVRLRRNNRIDEANIEEMVNSRIKAT